VVSSSTSACAASSPASLVEMRRVRDLQPYVGKEIEAKIIELDKNRNNVVLSRRAWLEQTQSEVRSTFLRELQKGQVRPGVVSSIVNFGAFVDLGGVDGLVHVSELSWKHIDHPSEVVEVGDEVTVEVLDVDMDRERVSLSLKATQEDPWQHFARTHAIGQVVPGKVTKLVPFGAFVRVADGIEGLVHISELAERHVELPEQVVTVGTEIFVKVIDIDLERRRISLSLKQANEDGAGQVEFDPTLYGMAAEYDEQGNYKYPEGFDAETNEWLEGFEKQREAWEKQYAEAHARWEAHRAQIEKAAQRRRRGRRRGRGSDLLLLLRRNPGRPHRGHPGFRRGARRPPGEAHRQLTRVGGGAHFPAHCHNMDVRNGTFPLRTSMLSPGSSCRGGAPVRTCAARATLSGSPGTRGSVVRAASCSRGVRPGDARSRPARSATDSHR
jgi:predicted RNA-binding protein with RPS1 domain